MIRVGISGPGGTGKTTLATALSADMRLPLVPEGVREWLTAERAAGPWRLSAEDQLRLQRHAIAFKVTRESLSPAFISDRTTVDAVTLMTLRFGLLGCPIPEDLRQEALTHARRSYDVAVLLTRQIAPDLSDEERIDPNLRVRECELTGALYESAGVPVIRVPAVAPSDVAPFVLEALAPFLARHA